MKRFYEDVGVGQADDGFRILLDGRPVKTPARNMLAVPTRAMAEAIAAEWRAQSQTIEPTSMPFLRLADSVIDGVAANRGDVIAAILRFAENDLLCYRAHQPPDLGRLQRENWDPVLDWVARRFGVRLAVVEGFVHVEQPANVATTFGAALDRHDSFCLAALHVAASITGSAVLALALAEGELTPAQLFALSRIDEDYQASHWGRDAEAEIRATNLARELDNAAAFMTAARN